MSLGLMLTLLFLVADVGDQTMSAGVTAGPPAVPMADPNGSEAPDTRFARVRSMVPYTLALVHEGYDRSPSFRELVDALRQSNVIVLVEPGSCAGGRIRSCLVSVNGSLRERHIRIRVDPQHTIYDRLIATVAHELQHAVEIAEHPEITNASGAIQLYRRIALGPCREGLSEECETTRALATEKKVLEELSHGRRRPRH